MSQLIINEINLEPDFAVHDDNRIGGNTELLVYNTSGRAMSENDLDLLYEIASMYAEVLYVERWSSDPNYAVVGIGDY